MGGRGRVGEGKRERREGKRGALGGETLGAVLLVVWGSEWLVGCGIQSLCRLSTFHYVRRSPETQTDSVQGLPDNPGYYLGLLAQSDVPVPWSPILDSTGLLISLGPISWLVSWTCRSLMTSDVRPWLWPWKPWPWPWP